MIRRALATLVVLGGLLAFFLFRMEGLSPSQLVDWPDTTAEIRSVVKERDRASRARDGRAFCATYAVEEQRSAGEGDAHRCPELVRPSLGKDARLPLVSIHVVRHFFDLSMNGALAEARVRYDHHPEGRVHLVRRGGHWRFLDYECRVHKTGCNG